MFDSQPISIATGLTVIHSVSFIENRYTENVVFICVYLCLGLFVIVGWCFHTM